MNSHDTVRGLGWLVALMIAILALGGTVNAQFSNVHNFSSASDGSSPVGGVAFAGTTLFGTANTDGANSGGTIWSFDTGTNNFNKLHDLSSASDGNGPIGGVAVAGTTLFGTGSAGGANSGGTIWSFDTGTNNFNKLHDLSSASDGNGPFGGVALAGTTLFGTAIGGGANGVGTIWSFDTSTNNFNKLHDFSTVSDGDEPSGGIVIAGTTLFGTANGGGVNDAGAIWSFDTSSNIFSKLHDFNPPSDGGRPVGELALAGTTLFGTANNGGANGGGTIWSFDTSTNNLNNLHDFSSVSDGDSPLGGVALAGTTLFGTGSAGGATFTGTIWSFDTSTNNFSKLHDFFPPSDGGNPRGGVALAGTTLFGTANNGGVNGVGTIWSFTVPEPSGAALAASGLVTLMGYRMRRRRNARSIR